VGGLARPAEVLAAAGLVPPPGIPAVVPADPPAPDGPGRVVTGGGGDEWVARRLLARMHAYSRRTRRKGVEPATAQDYMRFLLRWQHVAPGTQVGDRAGVCAVVEQLQGYEAAAVAWESELLARRVRHYDPAWLDRLCHDGEVAWLRLVPRANQEPTTGASAPSKATPICVVLRPDMAWLLAAARTAETVPAAPELGATAEIVEALAARGASFATELAAATGRLPTDIERGLWDGVARGLVMSDGFGAIRAKVGDRARPPLTNHAARRLSRLARAARATDGSAGRWSLVPAPEEAVDRDELAEAVAGQLLQRWGVVVRDVARRDALRVPWREIQWALRRLEDRGLVRGGRFVSGFTGEQYALPEAAEQLAQVRKQARTGERVTVNATDPLNLVGVVVPGDTVPAVRTNAVTYVDGVPAV
jgi:ATP-dependent Lhr-like helicase